MTLLKTFSDEVPGARRAPVLAMDGKAARASSTKNFGNYKETRAVNGAAEREIAVVSSNSQHCVRNRHVGKKKCGIW